MLAEGRKAGILCVLIAQRADASILGAYESGQASHRISFRAMALAIRRRPTSTAIWRPGYPPDCLTASTPGSTSNTTRAASSWTCARDVPRPAGAAEGGPRGRRPDHDGSVERQSTHQQAAGQRPGRLRHRRHTTRHRPPMAQRSRLANQPKTHLPRPPPPPEVGPTAKSCSESPQTPGRAYRRSALAHRPAASSVRQVHRDPKIEPRPDIIARRTWPPLPRKINAVCGW